MTCIVGMIDSQNDSVWIGGDSLGASDYNKALYCNHKVIDVPNTNNSMIAGLAGSYRHTDSMRYCNDLIPTQDIQDNLSIDHKYMVTSFIPRLIQCFDEHIIDQTAEDKGGTILIGAIHKLFVVQSDYSILEPMDGFAAIGSGEDIAMGSMFTTKYMTMPTVDKVILALKSAEHCGYGIQRPFIIRNTKSAEIITID